jgi:hypothetical protein
LPHFSTSFEQNNLPLKDILNPSKPIKIKAVSSNALGDSTGNPKVTAHKGSSRRKWLILDSYCLQIDPALMPTHHAVETNVQRAVL